MIRQFVVLEELNGVCIDKCPAEAFAELLRSYLQKLLKSECVLMNGKPVESNYRADVGDSMELEVLEAVKPEIVPKEMDLDIVHEDKDVVIASKPKGMVVHSAAGHYSETLVNGLMGHYKDELSGINGVVRPGIVHRIDMDITGLLIVCKNDKAHNEIARQLKEHSITRRYRAIIHDVVKEDEGIVDTPIGRHPMDGKKMSINEENGREVVTHYRVLERLRQFTYTECRLETGRTHQIRVHMVSTHYPLLRDAVYGPVKCPYKLQGQTLHAGALGFVHPETGEYMEFEAPLSEYFEELLEKLRNSWALRLFYVKYSTSWKGEGNMSGILWLTPVFKEMI